MRDISLHVLDIVQNSIKAGANKVTVDFFKDENGWLTMSVIDDGCGMSEDFLKRVQDPFTTTRTTRKVGLGIPLLKENTERTGGGISLQSEVGVGTTITARFDTDNIDCPPMGAICDTLLTLVLLNPTKPEFVFTAKSPSSEAMFDTAQVKQALGGVPLNAPDVASWIQSSIEEEFKPILEV